MLDSFDNYDGVIDHDTDRKDDAEEREVVDREAEGFHRCKRTDQRNWNRNERNDRGAPGLEKDQDDENDQRDCFEERLLYFMNRFPDRDCRVVNNCVVESGGKTLLEFSHFLPDRVGSCQSVRTGELVNRNRRRRFSAELTVDGVVARGELDPRDVAHASDLPVGASLNDNITELLFIGQPALRTDRVLKCSCAVRNRWRTDDSSCDLHILLLKRLDNILRRQITR